MAPKKRNRYSGSPESIADCLKPHANSPGFVFYGEDRKRYKLNKQLVLGHGPVLQSLHRLSCNLCFRKRTMILALTLLAEQKGWFSDSPDELDAWRCTAWRRIALMCRHVSQAALKGRGKHTTWVRLLLPAMSPRKRPAAQEDEEEEAEAAVPPKKKKKNNAKLRRSVQREFSTPKSMGKDEEKQQEQQQQAKSDSLSDPGSETGEEDDSASQETEGEEGKDQQEEEEEEEQEERGDSFPATQKQPESPGLSSHGSFPATQKEPESPSLSSQQSNKGESAPQKPASPGCSVQESVPDAQPPDTQDAEQMHGPENKPKSPVPAESSEGSGKVRATRKRPPLRDEADESLSLEVCSDLAFHRAVL